MSHFVWPDQKAQLGPAYGAEEQVARNYCIAMGCDPDEMWRRSKARDGQPAPAKDSREGLSYGPEVPRWQLELDRIREAYWMHKAVHEYGHVMQGKW